MVGYDQIGHGMIFFNACSHVETGAYDAVGIPKQPFKTLTPPDYIDTFEFWVGIKTF